LLHQIAAAARVGQRQQSGSDLDAHRIDLQEIFGTLLRRLSLDRVGVLLTASRLSRLHLLLLVNQQRQADTTPPQSQQRYGGELCKDQQQQEPAGHRQGLRTREELTHEFIRQVHLLCAPRDQQSRGQRNQ